MNRTKQFTLPVEPNLFATNNDKAQTWQAKVAREARRFVDEACFPYFASLGHFSTTDK